MIHALKNVTREGSKRIIEARCGETIEEDFSMPLTAASGWHPRVTCPPCRGEG